MNEKTYIHIRNWDHFQHPDVTRNRRTAVPWIKDATAQLSDEDYVSLSFADRGLLQSLRLQYALRRGQGINKDTTSLLRLLGQKVLRPQLERLNDAGFIEFSASKSQATMQATHRQKDVLDVDTDKDGEQEGVSQDQKPSFLPTEANNGDRKEGEFDLEKATNRIAAKQTATYDDDRL